MKLWSLQLLPSPPVLPGGVLRVLEQVLDAQIVAAPVPVGAAALPTAVSADHTALGVPPAASHPPTAATQAPSLPDARFPSCFLPVGPVRPYTFFCRPVRKQTDAADVQVPVMLSGSAMGFPSIGPAAAISSSSG